LTEPEASERIVVAAPHGRDGALMTDVLSEAGYRAVACASAIELAEAIDQGAGVVILTHEVVDEAALAPLDAALRRQPPWSDLPVLFFPPAELGPATEAAVSRLQALGNVSLLERPIRLATLLSAVAASLRSRRRQYELRAVLMELRDGVQQRDNFLAMLGHELRNPLAAIVSAVEVMELAAAREAGSDRSALHRAVIRRQGRVLARLVDDLLDVARVTSGKIRLHVEHVDLGDLVQRSWTPSPPWPRGSRSVCAAIWATPGAPPRWAPPLASSRSS
jgi:signal transduction histidine kinase